MKRKNGFTLIELLAVIVILAIIAVIAVPIVLNIIEETKNNATLRSAEFYVKAAELSIAQSTLKDKNIQDGTYNILESGNICLEYENTTCKEELVVEVNGEHPDSGTITITNGIIKSIDIDLSDKRLVKNDEGNIIYFPCELISGEENAVKSKYECEVKPGTKYNFYVLGYNDVNNQQTNDKSQAVSTNLIMERNICEDGTLTDATKSDKCLVAWNNETNQGTTGYGPVTAMNYLYNATKNWINIPNIEINHTDRGNSDGYGYGTITTINGVTKITKMDGSSVTVLADQKGYINLKSRMIFNDDERHISEIYYYLNSCDYEGCPDGPSIDGIYGHWYIDSPLGPDDNYAPYVDSSAIGGCTIEVNREDTNGVRPVITLKL